MTSSAQHRHALRGGRRLARPLILLCSIFCLVFLSTRRGGGLGFTPSSFMEVTAHEVSSTSLELLSVDHSAALFSTPMNSTAPEANTEEPSDPEVMHTRSASRRFSTSLFPASHAREEDPTWSIFQETETTLTEHRKVFLRALEKDRAALALQRGWSEATRSMKKGEEKTSSEFFAEEEEEDTVLSYCRNDYHLFSDLWGKEPFGSLEWYRQFRNNMVFHQENVDPGLASASVRFSSPWIGEGLILRTLGQVKYRLPVPSMNAPGDGDTTKFTTTRTTEEEKDGRSMVSDGPSLPLPFHFRATHLYERSSSSSTSERIQRGADRETGKTPYLGKWRLPLPKNDPKENDNAVMERKFRRELARNTTPSPQEIERKRVHSASTIQDPDISDWIFEKKWPHLLAMDEEGWNFLHHRWAPEVRMEYLMVFYDEWNADAESLLDTLEAWAATLDIIPSTTAWNTTTSRIPKMEGDSSSAVDTNSGAVEADSQEASTPPSLSLAYTLLPLQHAPMKTELRKRFFTVPTPPPPASVIPIRREAFGRRWEAYTNYTAPSSQKRIADLLSWSPERLTSSSFSTPTWLGVVIPPSSGWWNNTTTTSSTTTMKMTRPPMATEGGREGKDMEKASSFASPSSPPTRPPVLQFIMAAPSHRFSSTFSMLPIIRSHPQSPALLFVERLPVNPGEEEEKKGENRTASRPGRDPLPKGSPPPYFPSSRTMRHHSPPGVKKSALPANLHITPIHYSNVLKHVPSASRTTTTPTRRNSRRRVPSVNSPSRASPSTNTTTTTTSSSSSVSWFSSRAGKELDSYLWRYSRSTLFIRSPSTVIHHLLQDFDVIAILTPPKSMCVAMVTSTPPPPADDTVAAGGDIKMELQKGKDEDKEIHETNSSRIYFLASGSSTDEQNGIPQELLQWREEEALSRTIRSLRKLVPTFVWVPSLSSVETCEDRPFWLGTEQQHQKKTLHKRADEIVRVQSLQPPLHVLYFDTLEEVKGNNRESLSSPQRKKPSHTYQRVSLSRFVAVPPSSSSSATTASSWEVPLPSQDPSKRAKNSTESSHFSSSPSGRGTTTTTTTTTTADDNGEWTLTILTAIASPVRQPATPSSMSPLRHPKRPSHPVSSSSTSTSTTITSKEEEGCPVSDSWIECFARWDKEVASLLLHRHTAEDELTTTASMEEEDKNNHNKESSSFSFPPNRSDAKEVNWGRPVILKQDLVFPSRWLSHEEKASTETRENHTRMGRSLSSTNTTTGLPTTTSINNNTRSREEEKEFFFPVSSFPFLGAALVDMVRDTLAQWPVHRPIGGAAGSGEEAPKSFGETLDRFFHSTIPLFSFFSLPPSSFSARQGGAKKEKQPPPPSMPLSHTFPFLYPYRIEEVIVVLRAEESSSWLSFPFSSTPPTTFSPSVERRPAVKHESHTATHASSFSSSSTDEKKEEEGADVFSNTVTWYTQDCRWWATHLAALELLQDRSSSSYRRRRRFVYVDDMEEGRVLLEELEGAAASVAGPSFTTTTPFSTSSSSSVRSWCTTMRGEPIPPPSSCRVLCVQRGGQIFSSPTSVERTTTAAPERGVEVEEGGEGAKGNLTQATAAEVVPPSHSAVDAPPPSPPPSSSSSFPFLVLPSSKELRQALTEVEDTLVAMVIPRGTSRCTEAKQHEFPRTPEGSPVLHQRQCEYETIEQHLRKKKASFSNHSTKRSAWEARETREIRSSLYPATLASTTTPRHIMKSPGTEKNASSTSSSILAPSSFSSPAAPWFLWIPNGRVTPFLVYPLLASTTTSSSHSSTPSVARVLESVVPASSFSILLLYDSSCGLSTHYRKSMTLLSQCYPGAVRMRDLVPPSSSWSAAPQYHEKQEEKEEEKQNTSAFVLGSTSPPTTTRTMEFSPETAFRNRSAEGEMEQEKQKMKKEVEAPPPPRYFLSLDLLEVSHASSSEAGWAALFQDLSPLQTFSHREDLSPSSPPVDSTNTSFSTPSSIAAVMQSLRDLLLPSFVSSPRFHSPLLVLVNETHGVVTLPTVAYIEDDHWLDSILDIILLLEPDPHDLPAESTREHPVPLGIDRIRHEAWDCLDARVRLEKQRRGSFRTALMEYLESKKKP